MHMRTHTDTRDATSSVTYSTASVKLLEQETSRCMPTQTVYLTEDLYGFVISTKAEDQSTSERVRELVERGRQVEKDE